MSGPTHPPARRRSTRTARVSEIFGPTFQGEGNTAGERAIFIRFGLCNLDCGVGGAPMVCDTAYSWDDTQYDLDAELTTMTDLEIWETVQSLDPSTDDPAIPPVGLIVVTGGEPLIHKASLIWLGDVCRAGGRRMEIETNATIAPGRALVQTKVKFNAGLKLANCGVPRKRRIKPAAIREIQGSGRAMWKFVVTDPADLNEIAALEAEFGLTNIWVSPEGTDVPTLLTGLRTFADPVLTRGWNLTTRQQILIRGNKRGT
jgi:hypothetical protein